MLDFTDIKLAFENLFKHKFKKNENKRFKK